MARSVCEVRTLARLLAVLQTSCAAGKARVEWVRGISVTIFPVPLPRHVDIRCSLIYGTSPGEVAEQLLDSGILGPKRAPQNEPQP